MLHFFQERSSDYKERNKCFFLKIAPLALSVEARAALGMWTWSLSAMGKFSFTFSSAVPFSVEWEEYQKHRTLLGELSECLSEKWPKESLPCQHVVNTNAAVIIPRKALQPIISAGASHHYRNNSKKINIKHQNMVSAETPNAIEASYIKTLLPNGIEAIV